MCLSALRISVYHVGCITPKQVRGGLFTYKRLVRDKKSVDALCCLLAIEHPRFYCYTL